MPTETKNSTAKASRIGSASVAARRLNSDRPTTMPARNAPRAIETPKSLADPTAMPSATTEHGQGEQLPRAGRGHAVEQPGDEPPADEERQGHQRGDLDHGEPEADGDPPRPGSAAAEDGRQQHQHEDGEQVFDDQPADRDVAGRRVQVAVVREDAHQHDRARHRDRQAEDDAGRPAPAEGDADQGAEQGRDEALNEGAGQGDPPHGQQLLEVEVQADAEHEQDDADLGQLVRQVLVGDEAGRVRARRRSPPAVADDGRQPEAERDVAADECRGQAARQRQDEIDVVHRDFDQASGTVMHVRDGPLPPASRRTF